MSTLCISAIAFDSGNLLVIEGEKYVSCSSTLQWSLHWLLKLFLLSLLVPRVLLSGRFPWSPRLALSKACTQAVPLPMSSAN
jgi:hypothetical protein